MLKVGICDDQHDCVNTLKKALTRYLDERRLDAEITVFTDPEALLKSDWQSFHILFLDVVMGRQDGVQVAARIRRKNADISLIFVSELLEYATMGYQVKASAYLLKGQLSASFDQAMDRVLAERNLDQNAIDITVDGSLVSLPFHQISYIESQRKLSIFHGAAEYPANMRLSDVDAMLSEKGFLRIHRCYIVNLAHCVTIKNYQAVLDDGTSLPCSRQDYSGLVRALKRWKGKNL